mmetsp:Transcript_3503/g.6360  ORF Transcript_3503/g.6360 Transcript_3503/m.6360 type:complete len:103 (-) Transcript_3503:346-654(-)
MNIAVDVVDTGIEDYQSSDVAVCYKKSHLKISGYMPRYSWHIDVALLVDIGSVAGLKADDQEEAATFVEVVAVEDGNAEVPAIFALLANVTQMCGGWDHDGV